MNVMHQPHQPDHQKEVTVSFGGYDWDATAGYDVVSEPSAGTLTDPPEGLELDVWALTLTTYYGEGGAVTLPDGIAIDPALLEGFDSIEQACVDDWHDNHSRAARDAERADLERE